MAWYPDIRFVVVPGLHGSGPGHWQTLWERALGATRVHQDDWSDPTLEHWVDRVTEALRSDCRPAVVIAHSLGCLAVAQAWPRLRARVRAVLFVAPANPQRFGHARVGDVVTVPSYLVASRNDPWLAFDDAQKLADLWHSELIDIGASGHINADSGHGPWPEGWRLLRQLLETNGLPAPRGTDAPGTVLSPRPLRACETFTLVL